VSRTVDADREQLLIIFRCHQGLANGLYENQTPLVVFPPIPPDQASPTVEIYSACWLSRTSLFSLGKQHIGGTHRNTHHPSPVSPKKEPRIPRLDALKDIVQQPKGSAAAIHILRRGIDRPTTAPNLMFSFCCIPSLFP
jgi:hypothetical protein